MNETNGKRNATSHCLTPECPWRTRDPDEAKLDLLERMHINIYGHTQFRRSTELMAANEMIVPATWAGARDVLEMPTPGGTVPERAGREGDTQPLPVGNDLPHIHDRVIADIASRKALGIKRYGQPLQPHNGRNSLLDAYEEALDLAIYLAQALYEQENPQ